MNELIVFFTRVNIPEKVATSFVDRCMEKNIPTVEKLSWYVGKKKNKLFALFSGLEIDEFDEDKILESLQSDHPQYFPPSNLSTTQASPSISASSISVVLTPIQSKPLNISPFSDSSSSSSSSSVQSDHPQYFPPSIVSTTQACPAINASSISSSSSSSSSVSSSLRSNVSFSPNLSSTASSVSRPIDVRIMIFYLLAIEYHR